MASVDVKSLSKAEHDELCCSYAALMLHDDGIELTVSKTSLWQLSDQQDPSNAGPPSAA